MACDMEQRNSSFQRFSEMLALKPEKITEELETFYTDAEAKGELDCDICVREEFLAQLQKKYHLFDELYDEVLQGAETIREKPYYLKYTNLLRLCVKDSGKDEYIFFAPAVENEPAAALAPLYALLAYVEDADAEMIRRGIPKPMRLAVHKAYEKMILQYKSLYGFAALSATYYFWGRHYLRPDIYPIGCLEFEITQMNADTVILECVADGTLCPVRECKEFTDYYVGETVLRGGLTRKEQQKQPDQSEQEKQLQKNANPEMSACTSFSKKEYRVLLQPGDDILSVHIPRKAHIDKAHYMQDYEAALVFFAQYYPERNIRAITCHSWLMDPELAKCVKEGSNIMDFQHYYQTCPAKSSGKEVFSFVFNKPLQSYAELPENTTLERTLKKRYMEDDPIYAYLGVHMLP